MMFQGAYTSPFYRHLHHLLHHDLDLRRRLQAGPADAEALDALERLNREWLELGQLEMRCRSQAPMTLCKTGPHPTAPDLSKDWN